MVADVELPEVAALEAAELPGQEAEGGQQEVCLDVLDVFTSVFTT